MARPPVGPVARSCRLAGWLEAYRARLAREGSVDGVRKGQMDAVNPKYVLRNALAQQVIEAAEQGDMAPFERLFAAPQHRR